MSWIRDMLLHNSYATPHTAGSRLLRLHHQLLQHAEPDGGGGAGRAAGIQGGVQRGPLHAVRPHRGVREL